MEKPRRKRWSSFIFIMVIVMALVKFLFAFAYEDVGGHIAQALITLLGGIILLVIPAYFLGMLVDWFKKEKVSIATDVVAPDLVNLTSEKEFADNRSNAGSIDWETKSQIILEKPWLTKRMKLFIALLILIYIIMAVIISGIVDINKMVGSEPTPTEAPRVEAPIAPAEAPKVEPPVAPAPAPEAVPLVAPAPNPLSKFIDKNGNFNKHEFAESLSDRQFKKSVDEDDWRVKGMGYIENAETHKLDRHYYR
jgi:hypothetical protein